MTMTHQAFDPVPFFRALADPTRLRCIVLLASEGELCVCELTHALDVVQPKVSRHLAALREGGIVADRRAGYWVHYRLHPALPNWATRVIRETVTGIAKAEPFVNDAAHLASMSQRPSHAQSEVAACRS